MSKRAILLTMISVVGIAVGIAWCAYRFLRSFAPAEVILTQSSITSDVGFSNGLTIETIGVNSMGSEHHPGKYTATRFTTCNMDHPLRGKPISPSKIFNKKGKYWWTEEDVNLPFVFKGLERISLDTTRTWLESEGKQRFETCPLTFRREQWYLFQGPIIPSPASSST